MNFAITYSTEYRYAKPVGEQHNALRVRPTASRRQRVHSFDLSVSPSARVFHHNDYWGTSVADFGLAEPHDRLAIEARARVSTQPQPADPDGGWDGIENSEYRLAGTEFLIAPRDGDPEQVAALAEEARADTPYATVLSVCELIRSRFEYRSGVTYVGSTVDDLLSGGAGVCQDFTHLALAMLSHLEIASRYVSGYFFDREGGGNRSTEVDTHAWIEALVPADGTARWRGADPTNGGVADESYVKIGHGRFYSDVPPIKGVYRGRGEAEHTVGVAMVDLGEQPGDSD